MPARVSALIAACAPGPVLLDKLPPGALYLTINWVNSLSLSASASFSAALVAANCPPLSLEDLTIWPPEQVVIVSAPVRSVAVISMLLYELKILTIALRVITHRLRSQLMVQPLLLVLLQQQIQVSLLDQPLQQHTLPFLCVLRLLYELHALDYSNHYLDDT